jgi:hypothetical protein
LSFISYFLILFNLLSNPLWGKYQQYDYQTIHQITEMVLVKVKEDYKLKNPNEINGKIKKKN